MILRILSIIGILFLSGCKTIPLTPGQYNHSLNVQVDGEPWIKATDFKDHQPIENFSEQLDSIQNQDDYKNTDRVMIFIHGGLNRLGANRKRTTETIDAIKKWNENDTHQTIYPILINWHSRGVTWFDRLFRVRNGRIRQLEAFVTFPFALLADAGRTIGRLPSVYLDETMSMLSNTTTIGRRVNNPPCAWSENNHIQIDRSYPNITERWQYGIFQIVPGVARAITIPLADFALYESYQMMLRRIDMLFRTEGDYDRAARHDPLQIDGQKLAATNGAVSQLMHMLVKDEKKIILIGHSMGAIVVNEIVRRYPNADITEIIYMAAASTSKDFLDTIPPYLESRTPLSSRESKTKFYNLTLHPFADKDESTGFYLLPNGSLLEWLDTYVHRVKTPLDLTFGKWNNAMNVLPLLNDLPAPVKNSIYIKGFPAKKGFPLEHGDFGKFPYWNPNFWDPTYKEPFEAYR